ncbi:MAG: CarD family transcriptional regulator [Tissierellales bacterium]
MFKVGDLIIYSGQGICRIDEICEKTYLGCTRSYYVLHPIENCDLEISIPIDNDKVIMLQLIDKDKAEEIIESFKLPGIDWIDKANQRVYRYSSIVKTGDRKEVSMITNTLMREKIKIENVGKKFDERDRKLLSYIQNILFAELAISLNTTFEAIHEKIIEYIRENDIEKL